MSFNKFMHPVVPVGASNFGHLPEFAFPDHEAVRLKQDIRIPGCYYFCLTRGPGQYQFVVCKRLYPSDKSFPICLCLISSLPWFEVLGSLMEKIVSIFTPHLTMFINVHEVIPFLDVLVACRPQTWGRVNLSLPIPGSLVPGETAFSFEIPMEDTLFGRPPLPHFLKPLSPNKLLMVFSALLLERRIIVYSNRVDRLTHFMFGLTSLLYPLEWPHPFTPILCQRGLGYCAATVPFLFGVHSSLLPQVLEQSLESITWVNLDSNSVSNPEDDMQHLRPQSVANRLASAVEHERAKLSKKSYKSTGDALWNPFLSFWASLLVPCLKSMKSPDFSFDPKDSLRLCESSIRGLLDKLMLSQLFQQYIDERQHRLKTGIAPTREFDICAAKLSTVHSHTTLQAYFDSIAQHGLGVIVSSLVSMPTTPAPIPRTISPPVAIFTSALSESSDGSVAEEQRALPPKPKLSSRPAAGSISITPVDKTWEIRQPVLLSTSFSSSSYAPSSTSSLESGPPSYGSDLLSTTTIDTTESIPPSPISPSLSDFSSNSKLSYAHRNSDRQAASRLHDLRKPWEAKGSASFSGSPSSPSGASSSSSSSQNIYVSPRIHSEDLIGSDMPPSSVTGSRLVYSRSSNDWSSPTALRSDISASNNTVPSSFTSSTTSLTTRSSEPPKPNQGSVSLSNTTTGISRPLSKDVTSSASEIVSKEQVVLSQAQYDSSAAPARRSSSPNKPFAATNPFANPLLYKNSDPMFTTPGREADFDTLPIHSGTHPGTQ